MKAVMQEAIDFNELKASGALPSPKGVMLSIMRLCQREQVSLQELARTIQSDPVLAGRIIKIANSANPNKSRPIAAVTTDVLILIGVQAVRQVVLGLSLVTTYRSGGCAAFDYAQFWERSVAMACATQALAKRIRVAPVSEMFTCGLLADIGRLGLASVRPETYSRLLEQMADSSSEDVLAAETESFGFNHLSLAAAMMADWNIPRLFSEAVLFHENPHAYGLAPDSRQHRLAYILHTAARIADLYVASEERRATLVPEFFSLSATIGIDKEQLADIANEVSREWMEWGNMLQFRTQELPVWSVSGES